MAKKHLTLLHSNDLHGDFLAEQVDNNLIGGVSMLSGYINKVRQEEDNVIYAIAGDMFRGSIIDQEYKGISTIEIMNLLAPDVVTVGNHEVDYGIAHLLFIEKCATFPIINANLHINTTGSRLFEPCHIIQIDGMKILFIGILTEEVLASCKNEDLIGTFVDVTEAALEIGRICNTYNAVDIDLTVVLTHIGYEADKQLAELLDPDWGVDLIIGGHSHTFLEEPCVVNDIPIVQAGTGTDLIGRFDIVVDTWRNQIDSYTWQSIPINAETCPRDEELEKVVSNYKSATDEKFGRIVCRFARQLTHPLREQETELGNLFADILKDSFGCDIFFLGAGSIRLPQLGPVVRLSDLMEIFPYDDAVYGVRMTGTQITHAVKFLMREENLDGNAEFYQFSHGLHVTYDRATKEIVELTFEGQPLDPEREYLVGLQAFHFNSIGDFFDVSLEEVEANARVRVLSTSCREPLEEQLSARQRVDAQVEGRITVLNR